jgi:hypothetical protein
MLFSACVSRSRFGWRSRYACPTPLDLSVPSSSMFVWRWACHGFVLIFVFWCYLEEVRAKVGAGQVSGSASHGAMASDSRLSLHFSLIPAPHAYRFDVLVPNVNHVILHLCRILSSLYSGSVCIWDYQAQARARAGFHFLISNLMCSLSLMNRLLCS